MSNLEKNKNNIKKSKTKPLDEVFHCKPKVKNPENYKIEASGDFLADFEDFVYSKGFTGLSYTTIEDEFKYKFDVDYESIILVRALIPPEILKIEPNPHKHELMDDDFQNIVVGLFECLDYLRENGFGAVMINPIDREMDLRNCIVKSNTAVKGRNNICIFPEGPNVVLFAILCSIENLPFKESNDNLWIKEYCLNCGRCIKLCPENAFDENENLIKRKCTGYKTGCGLCIVNCPFFSKGFDEIKSIYFKNIQK